MSSNLIGSTATEGKPNESVSTENDSWSGPEHGGFWVFNTELARSQYFKQAVQGRQQRPTPEFYIQYDMCDPVELTMTHKFDEQGKFFAMQLFETRKIPLV